MITREEIHSIDDARALVRQCVVPSRAEKGPTARKAFHREDWCIARFVLRQLAAGSYSLPIVIERPAADPPDFVLTVAGAPPVAIEVTDAGPAALQKAATDLSRAPKGTMLEGTRLVPPGGKLTGRGSAGNEQQETWARDVEAAIVKKTTDLPTQPPAARFELLVYDQTGTTADRVRAAALVPAVPPAQMPTGPRAFDRVSVLSDRDLLLDVYGGRLLLGRDPGESA